MKVGKRILLARKELNLTQKQLAEKIGQPASVIARWETGRFNPSAKNLEDLARVLGKEYKYFYTEPHTLEDVFAAAPQLFGASSDVRDRFSTAAFAPAGVVKKGSVIFFGEKAPPPPFSLTVRDNSILPDFAEGDVLDVGPEAKTEEGKFYLARIDDDFVIVKSLSRVRFSVCPDGKEYSSSKVRINGRIVSLKKFI